MSKERLPSSIHLFDGPPFTITGDGAQPSAAPTVEDSINGELYCGIVDWWMVRWIVECMVYACYAMPHNFSMFAGGSCSMHTKNFIPESAPNAILIVTHASSLADLRIHGSRNTASEPSLVCCLEKAQALVEPSICLTVELAVVMTSNLHNVCAAAG